MSGPRFPTGFAWGAATSAYQVEGAVDADGKGESIWDRFVRRRGAVRRGQRGDVACDHYHRWREDVALLRRLGLTAYRFSIAWTRVQPSGRGPANEPGLAFYERLVDALLEAGVEPWVTLYHWDLPQALEDSGGWPNRDTAGRFADYASLVSRRLGDRVRHWLTVNEPWEVGILGYGEGVHAPGRSSLRDALAAIHVLLLAHGRAAGAIRAVAPGARVGLALDLVTCEPDRDDEVDRAAAVRLDGHLNRWFLEPLLRGAYPADTWRLYGAAVPRVAAGDLAEIAAPLDVVGLNYYYSAWVRAAPRTRPLRARPAALHVPDRTALGWAVHPDGIEAALLRLWREYGVGRIVVTESGAAYRDVPDPTGHVADRERLRYHERYLRAVAHAIEQGAPVDGYFAWSLLDNFEWQYGYAPRFGLVRVDYRTQRRTIKASGEWYAQVARANALVAPPGVNTPLSRTVDIE